MSMTPLLLRRSSQSRRSSAANSRATSVVNSRIMSPQRHASVSFGVAPLGFPAATPPGSGRTSPAGAAFNFNVAGAAFTFNDEWASRDCLLPLQRANFAENSYRQDLVENLTPCRQWLLYINIIACCCCLTDMINYARATWTGVDQWVWSSIILEITCEILWLVSGICCVFDFDPDKYPWMGLGTRPPPMLESDVDVDEGPSDDILHDYHDYLKDIEARLVRRFGKEFDLIGRRLEELELGTPPLNSGKMAERGPSAIPEHNIMSNEDLDASLPGMPWKLEDHLASLGARLHDIEVALSEAGEPSEREHSTLEDLSGDEFEQVPQSSVEEYDHLRRSSRSGGSPVDGLELQRMEEFEREELERMELQRLEGEELKRMEELHTAMMELEQTQPLSPQAQPHNHPEPFPNQPSSQQPNRQSWSSISGDCTMAPLPENSDSDHSSSGSDHSDTRPGRRTRSALSAIIPLAARVSELEVLVAKIVNQICTSSALTDKVKENLRTMTHQALRNRLPVQGAAVRPGRRPGHRGRISGSKKAPSSKAEGSKGKSTTPAAQGLARYRRVQPNLPYGRQHGVLPYGPRPNRPFTGGGSGPHRPSPLGTPGQPTRDSQGRL